MNRKEAVTRKIIDLRAKGLSLAEIAQKVGIKSVGGVKYHLNKSKASAQAAAKTLPDYLIFDLRQENAHLKRVIADLYIGTLAQ